MFLQRCFSKSLLRGVALFGEVSGSRASPFVFQWARRTSMKTVLLVGISCFTIGISSWAQQKAPSKSSVAVLLTRLQSQSDVERSEAFEALRSNPVSA